MKPIEKFINELQSLAEDKNLSNNEIKKRLFLLAESMDKSGAKTLSWCADRGRELITQYPNNANDIMNGLICAAKEDWPGCAKYGMPLLDVDDIRQVTKQAGLKAPI